MKTPAYFARKNTRMMQHHQRSSRLRQSFRHRPSLLVLLGAAALLAMLVVAGWSSVRAAPQSGAPSLSILAISDHTVTLQFENWAPGQTLTLSYSQNNT